MTLVTLDLLRNKLGFKPDRDEEAQRLLNVVVALWEQQTNRLWTRRVDHEQLIGLDDANDRRRVLLFAELYPIEAVEVREFDDVEDPDDVTLLDLIERVDYKLTKKIGEIKRIRFSPGFDVGVGVGDRWKENVRLKITGGFDVTDGTKAQTPDDVVQAILIQAQFMQARHTGNRVAFRSEGIAGVTGGGSVNFMENPDLHPHFKNTAARHRRLVTFT